MGQPNENGGTPFNEQLWQQSYGDSAPEPEPQAQSEPEIPEVKSPAPQKAKP